jgi:hypothetical protein
MWEPDEIGKPDVIIVWDGTNVGLPRDNRMRRSIRGTTGTTVCDGTTVGQAYEIGCRRGNRMGLTNSSTVEQLRSACRRAHLKCNNTFSIH